MLFKKILSRGKNNQTIIPLFSGAAGISIDTLTTPWDFHPGCNGPLQMLFGVRASWIMTGQQAQTAKSPEKDMWRAGPESHHVWFHPLKHTTPHRRYSFNSGYRLLLVFTYILPHRVKHSLTCKFLILKKVMNDDEE